MLGNPYVIFFNREESVPLIPAVPHFIRKHRDGLILWAFCFAAGAVFCWGMGVNLLDESWFLQVLRRFVSGETLYRDIAYDTPPLPVHVGSLACLLFGTQVLVTKCLLAVCFAFTVFFFVRAAAHMGFGSPRWTLIGVAFFLVYAPAYPNSMYNPSAVLFMTACLERCAAWIKAGNGNPSAAGRRLIEAGIAAGLSAACKQTIGALALAAAGGAVLEQALAEHHSARRFLQSACRLALPFFVVFFVLAVVPMLVTGTAGTFLEYGFLSKGPYLNLGAVRYVDQLRDWFLLLVSPSWNGLKDAYFRLPWLLPVIVLTGLTVLRFRLRGADRRIAVLLFLFAAASIAGAYPRYDFCHMGILMPGLGLGLFFIGSRLQTRLNLRARRAVFIAALVWLSAGGLLLGLHTARSFLGRSSCRSDLPHFKHVPIRCGEYANLVRTTEWIRRAAPNRRVFLLDVHCGFYSLAAELENPTPYDYPLTTMIGKAGHETLTAMIENGEIEAVIIRTPHPAWGGLWPAELASVVKARMTEAADGGDAGTLYLSRRLLLPDGAGTVSPPKKGKTAAGRAG
jgi:hypothetical protein